jgi:tetraacyldisaccharide 4'-kinase
VSAPPGPVAAVPVFAGGQDALRQRYLDLISGRCRGLVPALQRFGLYLLSLLYGVGVRLRNLAYSWGWRRSERVEAPVISVGNLTVGGTGKTPAVEYVAGYYRRHDRRVAILSRGYGAAEGHNDEALVLFANLSDVPHLQDADRVRAARIALEELESEVLILDDGFQHRRLARNLDVVLIDATLPWGYGYLLPRGLLREPIRGLRRAQLVLLTRCDQVEPDRLTELQQRIARIAPGIPVAESCHEPVGLVNSDQADEPLDRLRDRPIAAFCGLGHPEAFRRTLLDLGANLVGFRAYPDHHRYTREDIADLAAWVRGLDGSSLEVVTTQKDLVKIRLNNLDAGGGAPLAPLWALRIRLKILQGQDTLDHLLLTSAGMMPE